jgi:hypothetical protein
VCVYMWVAGLASWSGLKLCCGQLCVCSSCLYNVVNPPACILRYIYLDVRCGVQADINNLFSVSASASKKSEFLIEDGILGPDRLGFSLC